MYEQLVREVRAVMLVRVVRVVMLVREVRAVSYTGKRAKSW